MDIFTIIDLVIQLILGTYLVLKLCNSKGNRNDILYYGFILLIFSIWWR